MLRIVFNDNSQDDIIDGVHGSLKFNRNVRDVFMVQASEATLRTILFWLNMNGNGQQFQNFYGDQAKYIVGNLLDN